MVGGFGGGAADGSSHPRGPLFYPSRGLSGCGESRTARVFDGSKTMVDYSKWDNLDSDSDSGSDKATANQRKQKQVHDTPSSRKAAEEQRGLDQAEVLRCGGGGLRFVRLVRSAGRAGVLVS